MSQQKKSTKKQNIESPSSEGSRDLLSVKNWNLEEMKDYIKDLELRELNKKRLNKAFDSEEQKIAIAEESIEKLNKESEFLEKKSLQAQRQYEKANYELETLKSELRKQQDEAEKHELEAMLREVELNAQILKNKQEESRRIQEERASAALKLKEFEEKALDARIKSQQIKDKAYTETINESEKVIRDIIESSLDESNDRTRIVNLAHNEARDLINKIDNEEATLYNQSQTKINQLKTQIITISNMQDRINSPREIASINRDIELKTKELSLNKDLNPSSDKTASFKKQANHSNTGIIATQKAPAKDITRTSKEFNKLIKKGIIRPEDKSFYLESGSSPKEIARQLNAIKNKREGTGLHRSHLNVILISLFLLILAGLVAVVILYFTGIIGKIK